MLRYQKVTSSYRIVTRYHEMKKHKGTGKSIIATVRKVSTITYALLKSREPFDPAKMELVRKKTDPVPVEIPLVLAG